MLRAPSRPSDLRLRPEEADSVAAALAGIAAEAGRGILAVADRRAGLARKADGTVATDADLAAERLILDRLAAAFPAWPAIAEESVADRTGPVPPVFFLVDPLDGTSDFLAGGEFSVNIALVVGDRPVAAAIAAPTCGRVWFAGAAARVAGLDGPSASEPARARPCPASGAVALVSRRHGDVASEACLLGFPGAVRQAVSSAYKFCLVASGLADLYVRCGPTMEWDTAAGDHIVARAGGLVMGPDRASLRYGATDRGFLNGPFAALGDPAVAASLSLPERCAGGERVRPA